MLGRMGVDSLADDCPEGVNCKETRLTINNPNKIMRRIEVSLENELPSSVEEGMPGQRPRRSGWWAVFVGDESPRQRSWSAGVGFRINNPHRVIGYGPKPPPKSPPFHRGGCVTRARRAAAR